MIKITIESEKYPKQLRKIKNPPKQLYFKGNIELLNENMIAIIGSRNCSERGGNLAEKFAAELFDQGLTIVSGMAKGIDTAAHKGTLKAKGKTIAVLGSGFNHIFPEENRELYHDIIKEGGLVISEYPPDIKPSPEKFLERNRIISGLSIGILVVEAAYRSGTSVTARIAKEEKRKVFVLPHEIEDSHGKGTNQLIRKGAILITSTKEIIEEIPFLKYKKVVEKKQEKAVKNKREPTKKEQSEIYQMIEKGISSINQIHKESKKSIQQINQIILILEIEGYIKKVAGGYQCI